MKHVLLKDEYSMLIAKKRALEDQYKEEWQRKATSCDQSSETWHDNFDFEDATRVQEMIASRIAQVNQILKSIEIIEIWWIVSDSVVRIWKSVLLLIDWEDCCYNIWWYNTEVNWRIWYNSPLAKSIIWKKEWDVVEFRHWWSIKEIEIVEIADMI